MAGKKKKTLRTELTALKKKFKAGKLTRAQWIAGLDALDRKYPDPNDARQAAFRKRKMDEATS